MTMNLWRYLGNKLSLRRMALNMQMWRKQIHIKINVPLSLVCFG